MWPRWSDDRLLDVRMCDLGLKIEGSPMERCVRQLYAELERRQIRFRPHFWLSEEWFSPDGVPGVAIPFYLSHPRLMRLERSQMREMEDGARDWCMCILRHEVAHALDHAYRLHRRRRWQQLFGKSSDPYPDFYNPKPSSKRYVLHLDAWYAQSHPDEDFAETFAVWLKPRSFWRKRYQDWPALNKLEYVDELMREIAERKPAVTSRAHVEPLSGIRKTLREHYEGKRARYSEAYPDRYDPELRKLFSDAPKHRKRESAAAFIRHHRTELRRTVARWIGEYQYALDFVMRQMVGRCRELKLRVPGPQKRLQAEFAILLAVQTMNYVRGGRHHQAM